MAHRAVLGSADVSEAALAQMVATSLGCRRAEIVTSHAEEFPYDLPALTTAGRFWVRGTARCDGSAELPFAFFVKVVQSWAPLAAVPVRARAPPGDGAGQRARGVPSPTSTVRTCGDRLPSGLTMPRALAVVDLDDESAALWLEPVAAQRGGVGPRAAREGGVPARAARGERPGGSGRGQEHARRAVGPGLRRRSAGPPGAAGAAQRRGVGPPAGGRSLRRRAARAAAGRRGRCARDARRARRPAARHRPRRRLHPEPAGDRRIRRLHRDRLRLLGPDAARVRPRSAAAGGGPDG